MQPPAGPVSYLDAKTARAYEQTLGAPILLGTHPAFGNGTSPYPTLLFIPGAGGTISGYQAYLSEFASHGYAVVGIDYPGEAPYTALPYGAPGVDGIRDIGSLTSVDFHHIYEYRLADLAAVLNPFGGLLPALIAQYGAPFNTTHYAVLGHSMGGAASAGAMISAPGLYRAGSNLDGTFQHLVKPDPTNSTAVNGTAHLDYMDTPLGFDLLRAREGGVVPPAALGALGTIAGKRVTEVVTGLLLSFFREFVGSGAGVESVDAFIARTPKAFVMAEK
ncbi:hypothetical protein DBV05_g12785 [Lasiodiplodia theobromae]|uniref:AB hydrolase-1 domain-containing protein n=1 Tax=Lasiodiplodia theobromae TaxID=45133 RepID=A0A5N5CT67_9PEZI|nr:hypothetical protein DBV05_g12785 [Lasiodiplodia theobromae]